MFNVPVFKLDPNPRKPNSSFGSPYPFGVIDCLKYLPLHLLDRSNYKSTLALSRPLFFTNTSNIHKIFLLQLFRMEYFIVFPTYIYLDRSLPDMCNDSPFSYNVNCVCPCLMIYEQSTCQILRPIKKSPLFRKKLWS